MKSTFPLLLLLLATSNAWADGGVQIVRRITDNNLRTVQGIEQLPTPSSSSNASGGTPSGLSNEDIGRIVRQLRQLNQTADAVTVPFQTNPAGVRVVQQPAACDTGECLTVDVIDQPPPVIQTEMRTIPPQIQMVPHHTPPPQTHSLLYGFDQSYPQLPIVDVDNDTGCGKFADHYEIAVICIDGKPTQVLNPEPPEEPKRGCVRVFMDNVHNLVHCIDTEREE